MTYMTTLTPGSQILMLAQERTEISEILVLNAVLNSIGEDPEDAYDIQVYDAKETFDSLWVHEVIHESFDAGFNNGKLNILFLENSSAQIAVKTPSGMSKRLTILNIIMQGSVWDGLCCKVLMDKRANLLISIQI